MSDIITYIKLSLEKILHKLYPAISDDIPIIIELSKHNSHGDFSTPIAMHLASVLKQSPLLIANTIIIHLHDFQNVTVAGNGFINITLTQKKLSHVLELIKTQGNRYGYNASWEGQRVNIEYVSCNPTGPIHIGHARCAVVGDVLASILQACGADVCREYYINDHGEQIKKLSQSCFLRYKESLGESIIIPDGLYPGSYLQDIGNILVKNYQDSLLLMHEEERISIIKEISVSFIMNNIKNTLRALGIKHDIFVSEKQVAESGFLERSKNKLLPYLYYGKLEKPIRKSDSWQESSHLLFRSTAFGDDQDRVVQKNNKQWTYFAGDIGYHLQKISRGFDKLIVVLGSDHSGYISRLRAAVLALSNNKMIVEFLICQLVILKDGNIPIKMSKRAGQFITLQSLIDEVGSDAIRFLMLMRKSDAPMDFDLKQACEQSNDNPVFYVKYAYARCCSVLRMASAYNILIQDQIDSYFLQDPLQRDILRLMVWWPELIRRTALALEPHRIVYFMIKLASSFHALWTAGKKDLILRFIDESDLQRTSASLALVQGVKVLLEAGGKILGITLPETL